MNIVWTVFTVSLISSTLAVLIVIADKFLNNYGQCQIDINSGTRVLTVKGGSDILTTLGANNIFIPSACGGKATCGLCKVKVAGDTGPILPTEEPYLSEKELTEGTRLACQVKIKSDLRVSIPEELFNVQQFSAKVERITEMTKDIKEFRLALHKPGQLDFKAGQYIQLDSKPYDKIQESVMRAYSISSVPSDNRAIELIIRLVPGGICTTFMHKHVTEGDELTLRGPFGEFFLHEGADELLFIAGGSGLAPIKSMVFDILEKKLDKQMTFFFGAVSKQDLYYVDLFTELAKEHDNFRYIPALSDPAPEDDWQGETGLITEVVERYVEDAQNKQAYLCGSPGMIDACVQVLTRLGFNENSIFYDKF